MTKNQPIFDLAAFSGNEVSRSHLGVGGEGELDGSSITPNRPVFTLVLAQL